MRKKFVFILTVMLIFTFCFSPLTVFAGSGKSPYNGKTYNHASKFDDSVVVNGIDVSAYQGNIDWNKVKADGVDFAIIRVGGRGYGASGTMYSDDYFDKNIKGAQKAGIMVGVYYFSQAKTNAEAKAEARWTLQEIEGYDLQLPVFMDYEHASDSANPGRIKNLSKSQRTSNVRAFCDTIEAAGYDAGFYSNLLFYENSVDGKQISEKYVSWVAQYYNRCQYDYEYLIWQYGSDGSVNGISGRTDCNFMYLSPQTSSSGSSIAGCKITVADALYEGKKNYEPAVTVKSGDKTLKEGTDYLVGYIDNRSLGTAYAYVKGTGKYTGYQLVSFKISEAPDIESDFAVSDKYKIGDYVTGVSLETSVATFKKNVKVKDGYTFKVLSESGKEMTSGAVGTGDRLSVHDSGGKTIGQAVIVVRGDSDGDGKCGLLDLLNLRKQIVNLEDYSDAQLKAFDANNDGSVGLLDLLAFRKHIVGLESIKN